MSYLILNDYIGAIQSDNLLSVIGNNMAVLTQAQKAAQEKVTSYLVQKYNISQEFTDTNPYNPALALTAKSRIYLDGPAYNAAGIYSINALTLQAGNVYICTVAITVPEAFNIAHWALLGPQYTIFYVTVPNPEFDYLCYYKVGDIVWYKDKVYTCAIATQPITNDTILQAGYYKNVPLPNIFPDDPNNGAQYWSAGVAYSIAAYTKPTDTTKWTLGDNRNPDFVNICIDLTLYRCHIRIAPRNIPDIRVKARDEAIEWLKDAAQGNYITANLPLIQPRSGARIRFGGNTKIQNTY